MATTLSLSPFQSYDSTSGILKGSVFKSSDSIHLHPLPRLDPNESANVDLSVPAETKVAGPSRSSATALGSSDSVILQESALKSFDSVLGSALNSFGSVPLRSLPRTDPNENMAVLSRSTSGNSFMRTMLEILSFNPEMAQEAELAGGENLKRQRSSSSNISLGGLTNSRTWINSGSFPPSPVEADTTVFDVNQALVPHTPSTTPCEPTENDVLLGRGGRSGMHPGNKQYLLKKDAMQNRYKTASKNDKTAISQELVDFIHHQCKGRFLKFDAFTENWYEIENEKARTKCSQALRDVNTAEEREHKRRKYPKKSTTKTGVVKKQKTTKHKYPKTM
eukprot:scaffold5538_cov159-Amphora_coffeaeformis.AAC.14